jgi:DNA-binding response OmpR family regulator
MGKQVACVALLMSARQTLEDRTLRERLCMGGLSVRAMFDVRGAIGRSEEDQPAVVVIAPGAIDDAADRDLAIFIRRSGFRGLILVVGRSADPEAVVAALDQGADDYVSLLHDSTELVARTRALVRRAADAAVLEHQIDGLVLDLRRGVVRCGDAAVALTRREADLMEYLTRHAGHPVSREELATHIWHTSTPGNGGTNIVDVYVSYLRRKLGTLGRQSIIRSVRGVGYELVDTR